MNSAETLTTYSKDVLSLVTELSTVSLVVLGILVALVILGIRLGSELLVALNLSLYVAYLLYATFPYKTKLPAIGMGSDWLTGLAVFAAFLLGALFIVRRAISPSYEEGALQWLKIGLLALSVTLVGVVFVYALFPVPQTPLLTPILTDWLSNNAFFFWWLIVPLAALLLTIRR